jgi:hypothetical protein
VSTCSEHAVSMEKKPSAFEPPANFVAMQMKIGSERGLG